jgi:hypothetical protein
MPNPVTNLAKEEGSAVRETPGELGNSSKSSSIDCTARLF